MNLNLFPIVPSFALAILMKSLAKEKMWSWHSTPYSNEKISRCIDLHEIPGYGPRFTWSNKRHGEDFTKEKLDRVLANARGMEFLPGSNYHVILAL